MRTPETGPTYSGRSYSQSRPVHHRRPMEQRAAAIVPNRAYRVREGVVPAPREGPFLLMPYASKPVITKG